MIINIKLTPDRLSRCDPGVAEAFQGIECGGVSVDNEGTLVIIDDKEGVIGIFDVYYWESFEFMNDPAPSKPAATYPGGLAR